MDTKELCVTDFLSDYNPNFDSKRIRIKMHSNQNMLELSVDNQIVRDALVELSKNDFILGEHKDGISFFGKRRSFVFQDKNILKYNDVYYTLQHPEILRAHKPSRLLVIFSHFSGNNSAIASRRMYFNIWPDVQKYIVSDTFVLRIMDFNLTHGSWYLNTDNFNDFEFQIQSLIKFIMLKYKIDSEGTCLFGSSNGAVGALYHSLLGDFQCVVCDPILNDKLYVDKKNDCHFLVGLREIDLIPKFNSLINKNKFSKRKYIICNKYNSFNYITMQRLNESTLLRFVDLDMENAYHHLHVVGNNSRKTSTTLINICLDTAIKIVVN